MVHPEEQLSIEEITSPIGAQMLEFCESELFPETLQQPNSEVASSSNCCYEDQSSYSNQDMHNENKPLSSRNPNLSVIFEDDQNDISASIDFTTSPSFSAPHNHQYLQNNNNINNDSNNNNNNSNSNSNSQDQFNMNNHHQLFWLPSTVAPIIGPPPLPASYDDECMPNSFIRLRSSNSPACALIDPLMGPYLPSGGINAPFSMENSGLFGGNGLMLGNDLSHQELDFQGDNGGLFFPDSMQRVFNCSSELQALSNESQHLVHGGSGSTAGLASEISSLEDPMLRAGKASGEERKKKILRYRKKRNERNFSKKIKYACRKTLADSRPRVRGRFAKNDELGELARTNGHNEDDIDEDVSIFSNSSIPDHQRKLVVKEEDEMESTDIFAHISGVNSFKCNYPIQSWI